MSELQDTQVNPNLIEFNGATCLVVDDDKVFAQRLSAALLKRGLIVSLATNVPDAITIAENNPPDYAIVDLNINGDSDWPL